MTGEKAKQMFQAGTCLTGLVIAWKYFLALDSTEFGGGQLTGPLLAVHFVGSVLFVLALMLTFIRPRTAAASALIASLLCLPIYLYFVTPGLFRAMFPGDYSVPFTSNFVWESWAITGVLTVPVMSYLLKALMTGTNDRP